MKIFALAFNFLERKEEFFSSQPNLPQGSAERLNFFHKGDSVLRPKMPFFIPEWTKDMCCGVEVAVQINRVGKYVAKRFAYRYYDKLSLALDFTANDLLCQAIENGMPWSRAKVFDNATALGEWFEKDIFNFPNQELSFSLHKNGECIQEASTKDFLHTIDQAIAEISQYHTLKIGDIILLGSPAGVSSCQIGDHFEGFIAGNSCLSVDIK